MGYYIETEACTGKVKAILNAAPGSFIMDDPCFDSTGRSVTVCVVDNGPFEAAAVAFSKDELEVFANPNDFRPKTWLSVPRAEAIKLCPHVEHMLPPLT